MSAPANPVMWRATPLDEPLGDITSAALSDDADDVPTSILSAEVDDGGEKNADADGEADGDETPDGDEKSAVRCRCAKCTGDVTGGAAAVVTGGAAAVVGGRRYVVGGWGEYEANRRAATREPPAAGYPGRTVIGAADAVASLAKPPAALREAGARLSAALKRMETAVVGGAVLGLSPSTADIIVSPALTSFDVDALMADPTLDALADLADGVSGVVGGAVALAPPVMPPLPTRAVETDDAAGVRRLEADVLPYIARLERYQAAVASRLETAAETLSQ